jgi:NAD(P)-dependent dehydrogenase (short-subunit alcohol dehydrogenase family)
VSAISADPPERWFSLTGRVAVVTGGTGVLGGEIARGLAAAGARVGVLGRREAVAREVASGIGAAGGEAIALRADVLDRGDLERARDTVLDRWGGVDVLVNAAGGNLPAATVADGASVFDVPEAAWRDVVDLNLLGTVLPTAVFGAAMADRDPAAGVVVNVSSMAASRPLSRVVGYSAAKAAVENLTRWLAVDLAVKHGPGMRVNAVAPGFFLGEQNRALLVGADGEPTARGRRILDHTPLGRFGEPGDLVGAVVWLCSPAARFVTGIVVPVDGGYSAHGGV